MAKPLSDHEIAVASIHVFSDDGRLDLAELGKLLVLALRDEIVDEDEKRVLGNVLTRAERNGVDSDVQTRIDQTRQQHGLSAWPAPRRRCVSPETLAPAGVFAFWPGWRWPGRPFVGHHM